MTYTGEVLADSPLAYWTLSDAVGSTLAADSSGGGHPLTYFAGPTLGGVGLGCAALGA